MRLLHTSDWHLGQNFYSKSRAAEHDAFLTWLLDRAQEHEVDAIIVAGDILIPARRRATPANCITVSSSSCSRPAVAWWCWRATTTRWRCSMNPRYPRLLHTTVVANAGYAPIELPLRDGTPGAIFCPVPFLRPRELVTSQAGHSGREKQQLLLRHQRLLSGAVSAGLRCAAIGRCPSLPAAI